MKKTTKLTILALALTFALVLNCLTAFAAGDPIYGTETDPAQAAITKILQMPQGTDTPETEFVFEVKAIIVDGIAATPTNMPTIDDVKLSFDADKADPNATGDVKLVAESQDIFAGKNFPHAGIYVYEITEKPDTNTAIDANTDHETLTYSPAKYTLTVYVNNKADGSGTYIYAIGDVITVIDNDDQKVGDKVDPTPKDPDVTGEYSKMIFTNTYVKTNGPTDPDKPDPEVDDDSTLIIGKTVTGAYGNKELYFKFELTVTKPSLISGAQTYRAYMVEGSKVLNAAEMVANGLTASGTDGNGNAYIKVASGAELEFKLKDNQRLVFIDTPVGTSYEAKEIEPIDYTPDAFITTNGETAVRVPGTLSTTLPTGLQWVGELLNKAAYVNDRDEVAPTGLNLNDLPFIGMIVLALGAVAAFVVIKARKTRKARSYN